MNDTLSTIKSHIRRYPALLVFGVLFLILATYWNLYNWLTLSQSPPFQFYVILAINMLPGLVLLGWRQLLIRKQQQRSLAKIIFGTLSITILIGVLVGNFLLLIGQAIEQSITPIRDVSDYPRMRKALMSYEYGVVFPDSIPPSATQVRMYYAPAFLQGGASYQLTYKLPQNELLEILKLYREGTQLQTERTSSENVIIGTQFYVFGQDEEGSIRLPGSFEIMESERKDTGSEGYEWNHGRDYGIAIDSTHSTILYWANSW